jgi:hypothetical protein
MSRCRSFHRVALARGQFSKGPPKDTERARRRDRAGFGRGALRQTVLPFAPLFANQRSRAPSQH